jgi:putative endonuclease
MYYVYLLTNQSGSTIYVGVTNDLQRRIAEHQNGEGGEFTARYHVNQLVYVEEFSDVNDAIAREKQIKHWRREKKEQLIASQKSPTPNATSA